MTKDKAWLKEEAPKINQEEYELLKDLNSSWKWIARNGDGALGVYDAKVVKTRFHNFWVMAIKKKIDSTLFSFIQWEDEEPHNIAELIVKYEYSAEHVSRLINERVK